VSGYQRSSGAMGAVAVAFAVLAVLAVLTAGVTAGVVASGSSDADAPPGAPSPSGSSSGPTAEPDDEPSTFFTDGQVIVGDRRDNADLEVPSTDEGWTVESAGTIRGYEAENRDGEFESVAVTGPAVWKVVQCPRDGYEVDAPWAFAGFTAPVTNTEGPGAVRRANDETVDRWLRILRLSPGGSQSEPEYSETTISDGTPALVARVLSLPEGGSEPGKCGDKAVELSFLTFDTGEYSANVVVSRYVADDGSDLPGGLSADVVQQVLASPRLQVAP